MDKIETHAALINQLHDLYILKNKAYGNSVHDTYEKYGLISFLVRLEDKLNRARTLTLNNQILENDESIKDTLLDLANYAILAVMEMEGYDECTMSE